MSDEMPQDDMIKDLAPIGSTPVAPVHGIAAIALNMALKYHDINTIQDGQLYQQYKLEGKNIQALHLDHVFETAIRMEAFLLGASERIAKVVIDAIQIVDDDGPEGVDEEANPESGWLTKTMPTEVYEANITHNLNTMAEAAGIYKHLWRPDEIGVIKAGELIEPLTAGLERLRADPDEFRKLNAPNGWGKYENLVRFVEGYLAACRENPDATIGVSR